MRYYFGKTIPLDFDETVRRTIDALKQEGFGVVSDIDIRDVFKKEIGIDFHKYRILGACNPQLAHEALGLEDKIGTMLPCNVVVQDAGNGKTEVAAIDPVASMSAVDNPELKKAAAQVGIRLRAVVERL